MLPNFPVRLPEDIKPANVFVVQAKPVVLVAHEAAGVTLDELNGLVQADPASQVQADLLVAQSRHGGQVVAVPPLNQLPDLLHQPTLDHPIHPLVNAPVELLAFHGQADLQGTGGDGLYYCFAVD